MTHMIRVSPRTAQRLKNLSIVHNAEGEPTETYDSLIRRAIGALESQQRPPTIDVSQV